ncbi:hypothetical protein SAMD00019534_106520 [Acytostelium subglobosum LB1]|uniref:hypothetical protein n=1 Tax=Acytostelium subglobosum LB1 TaxID=1410327 RepID=UPI000644CE1A|nr:hypothetical protein SAMD00019534_106520 [Acytostelium subglobosum LB1]GAM27476.1 hypothetical protein SAMD00019534_106520 [Acytostelium subglobosum LB1]|eukprot:XP_012749541.1 hypothetical protein SAMD00019534_106520 [Acytostelium subglobosum LB1]
MSSLITKSKTVNDARANIPVPIQNVQPLFFFVDFDSLLLLLLFVSLDVDVEVDVE